MIRDTQYRYDADSRLRIVFEHDAIQRIIANVSGISSPADLLTKADTFGTPQVQSFASLAYTYYTAPVATTAVATPFAMSENLNTLYGGAELNEQGMVLTETFGGCGQCGSTNIGVKKTYFHLHLAQGATLDQNEVTRIVVEDTQDSAGTARYRVIYGVNDQGRLLRKAFIEAPTGTPKYWCESNIMATSGQPNRLGEYRQPSAHAVTSAANLRTFLDPFDSETNSWTNDTNTLKASDGVIYVMSHNAAGMRTDTFVKKGRTGTLYYVSAADYGDGDGDSSGEDHANGTLPIAQYEYPIEIKQGRNAQSTYGQPLRLDAFARLFRVVLFW